MAVNGSAPTLLAPMEMRHSASCYAARQAGEAKKFYEARSATEISIKCQSARVLGSSSPPLDLKFRMEKGVLLLTDFNRDQASHISLTERLEKHCFIRSFKATKC